MVPENIWSGPAAADYSSTGPFLFATVNSTGQVATIGSAGVQADGVLDNAPTATENGRLVFGGVRKIQAGTGGLALGDRVGSDANGKGVHDTTTTHFTMGVCVVAASAGNIAQFIWSPGKVT